MAQTIVNKELATTTDEASVAVNIDHIELLINTGDYDIKFGFDSAISNGNYRTLEAGDSIQNEDIVIGTLYYQSVGDVSSFKLWGKKSNLV